MTVIDYKDMFYDKVVIFSVEEKGTQKELYNGSRKDMPEEFLNLEVKLCGVNADKVTEIFV